MREVFCSLIILLAILGVPIKSNAQNTETKNDNNLSLTQPLHSPKKAAIYSAIIPGLGQAYNKKYWKIPIIYAGFATLAYFGVQNNTHYKEYQTAYLNRLDTITENDNMLQYTTENLRVLKNDYWKSRDFTIILTAALYVLNILDATVDAHLFYFDINKDLSLKIDPTLEIPSYSISNQASNIGLRFTLNF